MGGAPAGMAAALVSRDTSIVRYAYLSPLRETPLHKRLHKGDDAVALSLGDAGGTDPEQDATALFF